jgi:hypothetical protein
LEPVFFLGGIIWLAPNKRAAGPALLTAPASAVYKAPPFIIGTGDIGRAAICICFGGFEALTLIVLGVLIDTG